MKLVLDNGKEIELKEELSEQINELVKVNISRGFHDIDDYGKYYYIHHTGGLGDYSNSSDSIDTDIHDNLNAFSTQKFAQKINNRQLLERKLIKFSLEHDGYENDWTFDCQDKYLIIYNYLQKKLEADDNQILKSQGSVYFASEEVANQAIEKFHDELIQYYTEWNI